MAGDIRFFWIRPAGYATAYFVQSTGVCVVDRGFVTALETTPALLAAVVLHEATHARLEKRGIRYLEAARTRIEALCDAQSIEFARRLPDGEPLSRSLESRPKDPTLWTNETLDRKMAGARQVEFDAARAELEQADLPVWLKKVLRMVIRSRAA